MYLLGKKNELRITVSPAKKPKKYSIKLFQKSQMSNTEQAFG